jgi:hypothetical protein
MLSKASKSLVALTASFALYSGSAAAEFLDFTIDEGSVPGAINNVIIGDKLNGGYSEVLTFSVGGPTGLQFTTQAFATFGQIFANEGTPPSLTTQLSCLGPNCYNMYAVFSAEGVVTGGGTGFQGTSGAFSLYIDPDQNTTADLTGGGSVPPVLANTADDYRIAFASNPTSLIGIPGNPGAFDFTWDDFSLTTALTDPGQSIFGGDYFTSPDPFHMLVVVDGDFDEFDIVPGDTFLTGDVSAVFEVPAPTSIALLGLGLLGLGARRRNKA